MKTFQQFELKIISSQFTCQSYDLEALDRLPSLNIFKPFNLHRSLTLNREPRNFEPVMNIVNINYGRLGERGPRWQMN